MAAAAQPQSTTGLRRDAIGLREVLFQSITDMAPGAAIAASIPAGVAFAGGSLPLSVVFALVACLLCAWCIGLLSPRDSCRRIAGHLRGPRHPPGRRVPRGLGVCPGRLADSAAGAAAAWLHHRGDAQFRDLRLPGQPVVAVVDTRSADRAGGRLLRRQDIGPARHHSRAVRDRRVPGARRVPGRARGQPQHPVCVRHEVHPERLPRHLRGDRRLGVHPARIRRLRGSRAAGRGGEESAAHDPAGRAAGYAPDRRALCLHDVRGRRGVRARKVSPASLPGPAARPGRAWPAPYTGSSGSSCSWRS